MDLSPLVQSTRDQKSNPYITIGQWTGRRGLSETQMVFELPPGSYLQCLQLAFLLDKSSMSPPLKNDKYGFGKTIEKTSQVHRIRRGGPMSLIETRT